MFQKALMRLQESLEDTFLEIAQMVKDQPVVLLIDRGLLDGSAYVSEDIWADLMNDLGTNTIRLREDRYDGILHLVTAADGAPEFYASLNNEARYESIDEAIEKDKKLRTAYMGHGKWFLVGNNYPDFNSKINGAKTEVHRILNNRTVGEQFYRKFLLKKSTSSVRTRVPIDVSEDMHIDESTVMETFINYKSTEGKVHCSSIEKKGFNKAFTYTHKISIERNGQILKKQRAISAHEYIELESLRIPDTNTLKSTRLCLIEEELYMIFDYYEEIQGQPLTCII